VSALFAALCGVALANGCSAGLHNGTTSGGGGMSTTSMSSTGGGHTSGGGGTGREIIIGQDAGDAADDVPLNPCGTKCGPVQPCHEEHLGIDDTCAGLVDEGCSCQSGQAHFCFKGDPSYRNTPGCFDGTEICTEQGQWGPCIGGV